MENAYQYLAIYEKRSDLFPTLWQKQDWPGASQQTFSLICSEGADSDIGGGYDTPGLGDISLLWMIEKAR